MIDDGPGTVPRPDGTLVDGVTPAGAYLDAATIEANRPAATQELVDRAEALSQMFPRGVATEGAIVARHYGTHPEDRYLLDDPPYEQGPDRDLGTAGYPDDPVARAGAHDVEPPRRTRTECELRDELGLEPQTGPSSYGPPTGEPFPTNVELERLRAGGWDVENLESIPTARFEGVRRIVEGEARTARRKERASS